VEITKLSLRLKSAQKGKKLNNLDGNIKCGNSLIDDVFVAKEKAFDWDMEFKEIMKSGGFDVIVGNPPYVRSRELFSEEEKKYFLKKYETCSYQLDLYKLFIERSLVLVKKS
jgi:methylase of polypeptide subunit release factors